MALLIKGGEIVTASERYVADIFCENETITRIEKSIDPLSLVSDHRNAYLFPPHSVQQGFTWRGMLILFAAFIVVWGLLMATR